MPQHFTILHIFSWRSHCRKFELGFWRNCRGNLFSGNAAIDQFHIPSFHCNLSFSRNFILKFLNIDQFILSLSMISNWFRNFKDAIINLEYSVQVLGFCFVLMLHTFVTRIKHAEEMCNFLATTFNYFAVAFNSPRQLLRTAWGRGALVQLFTTK